MPCLTAHPLPLRNATTPPPRHCAAHTLPAWAENVLLRPFTHEWGMTCRTASSCRSSRRPGGIRRQRGRRKTESHWRHLGRRRYRSVIHCACPHLHRLMFFVRFPPPSPPPPRDFRCSQSVLGPSVVNNYMISV